MFVKKFLNRQYSNQDLLVKGGNLTLDSIEAYIKHYHYSNFDDAYARFDRRDMILLDHKYYSLVQFKDDAD